MKNKIKKRILMFILSNLPIIFIILLIISGLSALGSFNEGLTEWGEKNVTSIDELTIDQLIVAVNDKSIFTKEVLEDMMIDRKSLLFLLRTVNNYNKRTENKSISVEFAYTYTSTTMNTDKKGNITYTTSTGSGTNYIAAAVSNDTFIRNYELDWQTVYIMCLFKSINNFDKWDNYEEDDINTLSIDDVQEVIDFLKPQFKYQYDAVNNPKNTYTLAEASAVPNKASSFTISFGNTDYHYTGNVPVSLVSRVYGSYFTDVFNLSNQDISAVKTYPKEARFLSLARAYNDDFDMETYYDLMDMLPGGIALANKCRYILLQGQDVVNEPISMDDPSYIDNPGSIGGQIVAFALQFQGNPYVWGGTSLTNGADCSGFSQSVFKQFGINIPRTSREQSKSGKNVPLDEIQPGDLLFYTKNGVVNHVSIYIGGGKVVMAGSEATGIHTSIYNYRTPVKASRYY